MDKIELARAEVADIDHKIETLKKRRDELLRFIQLGDDLFSSTPATATLTLGSLNNTGLQTTIRLLGSITEKSKQDRIIACAVELISQSNGKPVPTREIMQFALMKGINVAGKTVQMKVLAVSAILSKSKSPRFKSERGAGWLIDEQQ